MVLSFEQIKELIELVASHRLGGVEMERSGFRLKIDGHSPPVLTAPLPVAGLPAAPAAELPAAPPAVVPAAAPAPPAPAAAAPGEAPEESEIPEIPPDAQVLHSPIVGTFYRAPSPGAEPFIEIGDRVKQGQIVCIVEAMKLMNEIEADVGGLVVAIFPKNAQPVEFGEPLIAVKSS